MANWPPFVDAFLLCHDIILGGAENSVIGITDTYRVSAPHSASLHLTPKFYVSVKHSGTADSELRLLPRLHPPAPMAIELPPPMVIPLQKGRTTASGELEVDVVTQDFGSHLIELVADDGTVMARTAFQVVPGPAEEPGIH